MNQFQNFWLRLKTKPSDFFIPIRNCCASFAVAGVYLKSQDIDFTIHHVSVVSILIGAGAVGAFLSQLTRKDNDKNVSQSQDNLTPPQN